MGLKVVLYWKRRIVMSEGAIQKKDKIVDNESLVEESVNTTIDELMKDRRFRDMLRSFSFEVD